MTKFEKTMKKSKRYKASAMLSSTVRNIVSAEQIKKAAPIDDEDERFRYKTNTKLQSA